MTSTNDTPGICTNKSTFDVKDLYENSIRILLNNEFFNFLKRCGIITEEMVTSIIYIFYNKTNYSFSYTLAQFIIDMKAPDFPNRMRKLYKYYPVPDSPLKLTINKALFDTWLLTKEKDVNPFMFFGCNSIDNLTPLYSYQKFLVIVLKYIK
jgi:hypothetical protein